MSPRHEIFSEEEKKNFQNAFDAFDDDRDHVIPTTLLGKLLRAVGFNPYPEEVEDMIEDLTASEGSLDFKSFYYLLCAHARAAYPEEELVDAFQVFDTSGEGRLSVDTIQNILRSLKQPFTEDQIAELLSQADVDAQSKVNYRDFVKVMLDF
jgi:Ca2+-binding EF-hand superfamily protein